MFTYILTDRSLEEKHDKYKTNLKTFTTSLKMKRITTTIMPRVCSISQKYGN